MSLFDPYQLRGVHFRNRIAVSPMCEYSAHGDGVPTEWHLVHLGSRAVGGAGLVMTEATAVEARGRISPGDTGIYTDAQTDAWRKIAKFIKAHGASPGMQLAHAGRKASTDNPFPLEGTQLEPWEIVAPSAMAFDKGYQVPAALDRSGIESVVQAFASAAVRAVDAGFEVLEIHGAHGYLINEFLSPLSNRRTDEYGGDMLGRTRFVKDVVNAIRAAVPDSVALFLRISASDWVDGGWDIDDSVSLAKSLKPLGVDLIDVSSGGLLPGVHIPIGPGYQVGFARQIREQAEIPVGAVGMITQPRQAEEIVGSGSADLVLLAREMLRDPYWPRRAAEELGASIPAPLPYGRAW